MTKGSVIVDSILTFKNVYYDYLTFINIVKKAIVEFSNNSILSFDSNTVALTLGKYKNII